MYCIYSMTPLPLSTEFYDQQECIPVGCVPSAAVAVCRGGAWSLSGGCLPGGVCPGAGVSARGRGCLTGGCLPGHIIINLRTIGDANPKWERQPII